MAPKRGMLSQVGFVDEGTYGTAVTVTKFQELRDSGESIKLDIEHVASKGMRAGRFNKNRSGAYVRWRKGAAGSLPLEIPNKGFGFWLKHMMGIVATTGPVTTAYTHTGTAGSLAGDSFTLQIVRDDQAFTYEGGKIMEWNIKAAVGEIAEFDLDLDFEDENTAIAAAVANYPTNLQYFSFLEGLLTIGGTPTDVKDIEIHGNNNPANERYFIRQSGLKKEPQDQDREYTGSLTAEFENMTLYNMFVNGTEAALILKFEGGVISGAEKYTLTITCPAIVFTGETPNAAGPEIMEMSMPFQVLDDSISIAYKTTDATP